MEKVFKSLSNNALNKIGSFHLFCNIFIINITDIFLLLRVTKEHIESELSLSMGRFVSIVQNKDIHTDFKNTVS